MAYNTNASKKQAVHSKPASLPYRLFTKLPKIIQNLFILTTGITLFAGIAKLAMGNRKSELQLRNSDVNISPKFNEPHIPPITDTNFKITQQLENSRETLSRSIPLTQAQAHRIARFMPTVEKFTKIGGLSFSLLAEIEKQLRSFNKEGILLDFLNALTNLDFLSYIGHLPADLLQVVLKVSTKKWSPEEFPQFEPLHLALFEPNNYKLILSHYPKAPFRQKKWGNNHLMNLLFNEKYEAALIFLDAVEETRAEIDFGQQDYEEKTIYHAIALLPSERTAAILEKILTLDKQAKVNINKAMKDGVQPFHFVCALGRIDLAEAFIKAGADLNGVDKSGNRPQHYLAKGRTYMETTYRSIDCDERRDQKARNNALCFQNRYGDCTVTKLFRDRELQGFQVITTGSTSKNNHILGMSKSENHVLTSTVNAKFFEKMDTDPSYYQTETPDQIKLRQEYIKNLAGISVIDASLNGLIPIAKMLCMHREIDPQATNNENKTVFDLLAGANVTKDIRSGLRTAFKNHEQQLSTTDSLKTTNSDSSNEFRM